MNILAIADVEERCLWECFRKERFEDVDLILSAGDLDPDYLEFLVTVINKPLVYVRGNHDDRYARHARAGAFVLRTAYMCTEVFALRVWAVPCATATARTCIPSARWQNACASYREKSHW